MRLPGRRFEHKKKKGTASDSELDSQAQRLSLNEHTVCVPVQPALRTDHNEAFELL